MKIINALPSFTFAVLGIFISTPTHATQLITPAGTGKYFVGSQETVTYSGIYSVSSPHTDNETGIGLRVHYNSSLLTPTGNQRYNPSSQPKGEITNDTEDYDADPLTDKYFILSWADVNAQWPGQNALPLNLFEAQFTTKADFKQNTNIRITTTSTARNIPMSASQLLVCAKPTISLSDIEAIYPNGNVRESNASHAAFTITSDVTTCAPVALNYTLSGTATPNNDYIALLPTPVSYDTKLPETARIGLNIIDDDETETDETIILTLEEGADYLLGSPTSATITIQSDDTGNLPGINLSTGKTTVTEGSSGSLIIYATRGDQDLSAPLEVFIQLGGTASVGSDYQPFPNSITIPAGKKQSFAVLVLKDDDRSESHESITVSITANAQYQRGSFSTLEITIEDDEVSHNTSLVTEKVTARTSIKPVPTLNEWMLLLLSLLIASLALIHLITTRRGNT